MWITYAPRKKDERTQDALNQPYAKKRLESWNLGILTQFFLINQQLSKFQFCATGWNLCVADWNLLIRLLLSKREKELCSNIPKHDSKIPVVLEYWNYRKVPISYLTHALVVAHLVTRATTHNWYQKNQGEKKPLAISD